MLPIYYIGFVQAFFAALLISKKESKSQADFILIIWLSVIGLEMVYSLLNLTIAKALPDLIVLPLTYGPFLYLYTKQLISNDSRVKPTFLLHFIPFLIGVLIAIFWKDTDTINRINYSLYGNKTIIVFFDYFMFLVSITWYWILVFKLIAKHQKKIGEQLSFQNNKTQLNWIKTIALWILAGFIFSSVCYVVFLFKNISPFNPIVIYHLALLMFIFSISYYGIYQPPLPKINTSSHFTAAQNTAFDTIELVILGERLEKYMNKQKPYLNGELTIHDVAHELGESEKKISIFLNNSLKKNFFVFINDYRINEAKQRLTNSNNKHLTLLAIAFDSGFNSKSTFNSLFKKYCGVTPSEYQKQHFKDNK